MAVCAWSFAVNAKPHSSCYATTDLPTNHDLCGGSGGSDSTLLSILSARSFVSLSLVTLSCVTVWVGARVPACGVAVCVSACVRARAVRACVRVHQCQLDVVGNLLVLSKQKSCLTAVAALLLCCCRTISQELQHLLAHGGHNGH